MPNRAERRRAAQDVARQMQHDPLFAQQVEQQQREQAITGLVEKHETAMQALKRANRDLASYEVEVQRLAQQAQADRQEQAALLGDLDSYEVDISDACSVIEELLLGAPRGTWEQDTQARVEALLTRLRPAEESAPDDAPTADADVPPDADDVTDEPVPEV